MLRDYSIVIADTSCFILLDKINELHLLRQVFHEITTTHEIAQEFGKPLPDWIKIKSPVNKKYHEILSIEVDAGEATAIALALENNNSLIILDDFRARKLAEKLGLQYAGTLGIILKAKELKVIPDVRSVLEKIQKTNFRFSEKIFREILSRANE
jgi:predicted nucleic acid-binding protein